MPPAKKNGKKMDLSKDIEDVVKPRRNESREELVVPEQQSSFAKIAFTFIGLAIILIVGVFYFSYFYTTLIVTPNQQPIETTFDVQVTLIDKIKEESGELGDIAGMLDQWTNTNPEKLAGEVLEVEIEKEETFQVTGEAGEEKPGTAHGKIKIFNTQNVAQSLVTRTRFQAENGVVFRIRQAVTVPANGELEVEIFADEEGAVANIAPTKFILPGFTSEAKRKAVYAESYQAMTGGVVREKILTQDDINTAKQDLENRLFEEGLVALDDKLKNMEVGAGDEARLPVEGEEEAETTDEVEETLERNYDTILPQAVTHEVVEVLITPEIGTKTQEFTLKMKIRIIGILFDEETLLILATVKIREKGSDTQQVATVNEDSLTYQIKRYEEDLGMAVLEASITGEGYVTSADLLGQFDLKSLEADDIEAYLDEHPEIANIEIKEAPIWMRKLPILKDRVRVKVELP